MSFEKSTVILSLRLLTPSENRNGRTFYFEKITVILSLHLPHSNWKSWWYSIIVFLKEYFYALITQSFLLQL